MLLLFSCYMSILAHYTHDSPSFLYQIDRQNEVTCTCPSHGNSVHLSSNITDATKSDEVHKVLKKVLTSHFADLSNQLSRCLPQVAAEMYSKDLISKSVRDSPTAINVINEFERGLEIVNEDILKLQEHCQLFLQCLSSEGGPTKLVAQNLCKDWMEEVKRECDIALDLLCYGLGHQNVMIKQGGLC